MWIWTETNIFPFQKIYKNTRKARKKDEKYVQILLPGTNKSLFFKICYQLWYEKRLDNEICNRYFEEFWFDIVSDYFRFFILNSWKDDTRKLNFGFWWISLNFTKKCAWFIYEFEASFADTTTKPHQRPPHWSLHDYLETRDSNQKVSTNFLKKAPINIQKKFKLIKIHSWLEYYK